MIAVNGKAIMSIEDLLEWVIMEDVRWIDGFPTICPNPDHASRTTGERQGAPSTTTTTEEQGRASTFQGVASKNQDGDAIEELSLSRLRCTDEPATNSNGQWSFVIYEINLKAWAPSYKGLRLIKSIASPQVNRKFAVSYLLCT